MPGRKRSGLEAAQMDDQDVKPKVEPETPDAKRAATSSSSVTRGTRSSARITKKEEEQADPAPSPSKRAKKNIASNSPDPDPPATPPKQSSRRGAGAAAAAKKEESEEEESGTYSTPRKSNNKKKGDKSLENGDQDVKPSTPSNSTLAKKLKQLEAYLQTPYPDYKYPTPDQCQELQDGLARIHGLPKRPERLVDRQGAAAGCGATPDVMDALIRTILSQNTTSKNSTTAKNAMDEKYGRANHIAIHRGTVEELADTIACGGLANVKSKVIKKVLAAVLQKQIERGEGKDESEIKQISLDYLHDMGDLDAMKELVSFDGVGPKTASCVLLFCLGRNSFAVDTHVFRITKALGWIPAKANRETAFQHLDVRIPDENKYALHSLIVRHGRSCRLCSANGNITDPEVDSDKCPIKAILKAKHGKSPRKLGSTRDENDENDDDDVIMPGDIEDKEEAKGKPPFGAPDSESAEKKMKEEEEVQWENFGENKDGKMHGL